MSCIKIRSGLDTSCDKIVQKYFQQVVLVNKDDVEAFLISTPYSNINDEFFCRYRIAFKLKEGKSGYRITSSEMGNGVFGFYNKTIKEDIPQYKHTIQISIVGIDEKTKCVLDQLDMAQYFAVIQFYDGSVEVYGFEFGLRTEDYEYNPANNNGGALISLSSDDDALEDERPYIYVSGIDGNENNDFNNNFSNNPDLPTGDFNNDFSNDFYIE